MTIYKGYVAGKNKNKSLLYRKLCAENVTG